MKFILPLMFFLYTNVALAKEAKTLIVIGDSLTEGYGVAKSAAYPAILDTLLDSEDVDYKVINAGSTGSTTASAVKRLDWHLKRKPNYIMIALGANDGLRGFDVEVSKKNLKAAIIKAKENNVGVILAGMKMPMNYGKKYRSDFESIYSNLAKTHELIFIPFLVEGVGGVKELNLADGIHPNEKGHKKIAEHVHNLLKDKLK